MWHYAGGLFVALGVIAECYNIQTYNKLIGHGCLHRVIQGPILWMILIGNSNFGKHKQLLQYNSIPSYLGLDSIQWCWVTSVENSIAVLNITRYNGLHHMDTQLCLKLFHWLTYWHSTDIKSQVMRRIIFVQITVIGDVTSLNPLCFNSVFEMINTNGPWKTSNLINENT